MDTNFNTEQRTDVPIGSNLTEVTNIHEICQQQTIETLDKKTRRRQSRQYAKKQNKSLMQRRRQILNANKELYKRIKLNQRGVKKLTILIRGLKNTLLSISSYSGVRILKTELPVMMLEGNITDLTSKQQCNLINAFDDIFNYALGPRLKDKLPKKVWRIIPRRDPELTERQASQDNPLVLYYMAIRHLGGQEIDPTHNIDYNMTLDMLQRAVNVLAKLNKIDYNKYRQPQTVWGEYYTTDGWCLTYHLFWTMMTLLTGDKEELRRLTYLDQLCHPTNQIGFYGNRHINRAEMVFLDYLRFTSKRMQMNYNIDTCDKFIIDLHHMVHYDMLRMFFQHVWSVAVGSYINYPVVGTPTEVKVITACYPLPHLFMFVQGYDAQTSVAFPLNLARIAKLFLDNRYRVGLATELINTFKHHVRTQLDNNYLSGLEYPFMDLGTIKTRNILYNQTQPTIKLQHSVWEMVLNDFNDYMMSCSDDGSPFLKKVGGPLDNLESITNDSIRDSIIQPSPLSSSCITVNMDNVSDTSSMATTPDAPRDHTIFPQLPSDIPDVVNYNDIMLNMRTISNKKETESISTTYV